ncbi:MAG: nucleotidyltransferase family protein [Oscillospiraceae bacterium]|nr:nucleotidyltransferase family protein [Oscillospiraceae bacterium]
MTPEKILFSLLRAAVCSEPVADEVKNACTPDMLKQVYVLAKTHDLAHIPGQVLSQLKLPECEPLKRMTDATFMAVQRYVQLDYELTRICDALEQAKIPFIPLKGAVIRKFYPQPWMRTSCDIDVLVHEEDLERAVETLVSKLSYTTDHKKKYHDVWLFSPSGIHLELHFSILETMENIDQLLSRVWEFAAPVTPYRYALSSDFLAFHLLAHMSYHFTGGGCGIRSLLDIFLLREQKVYDEAVLRGYLAQCGIEKFYDAVVELISVWFQGAAPTPLAEKMENYLLTGGMYGSEKKRIAIQQQRKGGKLKYLLDRLFMPYRELKIRYRVLEKCPILYPVMLVRRWIELLFGGRLSRSLTEAKTALKTQKGQSEEINDFLRQIGL